MSRRCLLFPPLLLIALLSCGTAWGQLTEKIEKPEIEKSLEERFKTPGENIQDKPDGTREDFNKSNKKRNAKVKDSKNNKIKLGSASTPSSSIWPSSHEANPFRPVTGFIDDYYKEKEFIHDKSSKQKTSSEESSPLKPKDHRRQDTQKDNKY